MKSTLDIGWNDWCWSWSSNTLAIWYKEPIFFGRDPNNGKEWRQNEKRVAEDEVVRYTWIHMILSKLWKTVEDRGTWCGAVHGVQRVGHDLVTEQQQRVLGKVSWKKPSEIQRSEIKPLHLDLEVSTGLFLVVTLFFSFFYSQKFSTP